jgi:hypothetical protein
MLLSYGSPGYPLGPVPRAPSTPSGRVWEAVGGWCRFAITATPPVTLYR